MWVTSKKKENITYEIQTFKKSIIPTWETIVSLKNGEIVNKVNVNYDFVLEVVKNLILENKNKTYRILTYFD